MLLYIWLVDLHMLWEACSVLMFLSLLVLVDVRVLWYLLWSCSFIMCLTLCLTLSLAVFGWLIVMRLTRLLLFEMML